MSTADEATTVSETAPTAVRPPMEELTRARADAIERSGWGNRVVWRQPRNPCLWVYLVLVGYGVYYTVTTVQTNVPLYGVPLGVAAVIFAGYAIPFWWFTVHIDRYSRQPGGLRVAAFLYGGLAATWTIALHGNTALGGLYAKAFGQEFALKWGAGLTAPIFEELGKGSGVVLLLFIAPQVIRTAYDGFIIGAFVGIGFEIIEDILYALNAAPEGFGVDTVGNVIQLSILRLATGFTSHIAYASIFGAGLIYLIGTAAQRRRPARGVALCLTSMVLHGTWDAAGALSFGSSYLISVLLFVFIVVAIIAVLVTFRITVRSERQTMRDVLAPEVATGVLTDDELDALAGDRRARRRYRHAGHGHSEKKRRHHRLQAGHDLADALAASRGTDNDHVQFTRTELQRVGAR